MALIDKYLALPKSDRRMANTFLTFLLSMIWSVAKLVLGVVESSNFLFASAMFTMCLAVAKLLCLVGLIKEIKPNKSLIYNFSSILIVFSGAFYGFYNVRLLGDTTAPNYGLIPSIAVAAVSFFLFVRAIVYLIKDRGSNGFNKNLRAIAFVGGCMDIVLTQMCLLAVEMPDMPQAYNSYIALGLSVITIVLGIYRLFAPKILSGGEK